MNKIVAATLGATIAATTLGVGATVAQATLQRQPARIVAAPSTVPARWEVPPRRATIVRTTLQRTPNRVVAGPGAYRKI